MLPLAAHDDPFERILYVAQRFAGALEAAQIPYCVVGGLAVWVHVDEVEPMAARLTRDINVTVNRGDVDRVFHAAKLSGFSPAGEVSVFRLPDVRPRPSVHVHESELTSFQCFKAGIRIAPVADLVHMKLTDFRLIDKVHIQDMDSVGLITAEIEANLSPLLLGRLAEVRRTR